MSGVEARGRWVRRGMVWVQLGPRPVDEPDPETTNRPCTTNHCVECGGPVSRCETKRCTDCHTTWLRKNATGRRRRIKTCPDCGQPCYMRSARCKPCSDAARRVPVDASLTTEGALIERLTTNLSRPEPLGVICDVCGCLCRRDEDCPGCRVWAREREAEANRRHIYNSLWTEAA